MRVAITQSNYLPWRGFFALLRDCDAVVQFDGVQYTKRDWRTRNRIRWQGGPKWLTVPVHSKSHRGRSIFDIEIADRGFGRRHWSTLQAAYRERPGLADVDEIVGDALRAESPRTLSELNAGLTGQICDALGIATVRLDGRPFPYLGDATQKLLDIAREVGACTYVSGPAAKAYLDTRRFEDAGIAVEYVDYGLLAPAPGDDQEEYSIIHTIATGGLGIARRLSTLVPPDRGADADHELDSDPDAWPRLA